MPAKDNAGSPQNPLECQCPDCERPKMHETRLCIKCYTHDCKGASIYAGGNARCA